MKLFKKNKKENEEKQVILDENGNVIDHPNKKKGEGKVMKIVKKVAVGLGLAAVGVATFVAVGVAMAYSDGCEDLSTTTDNGDETNTSDTDESVSEDNYSDEVAESTTEE